jgi:hypothetical protein
MQHRADFEIEEVSEKKNSIDLEVQSYFGPPKLDFSKIHEHDNNLYKQSAFN